MPSTILGRDEEFSDIRSRLATGRLVTVIGPGGVGKTALAEAIMDDLAHAAGIETHNVYLTSVADPSLIKSAVARQLEVDSFEALLSMPPRTADVMLIDNCEHLVDAAADTIAQLLGAHPLRTILATSRVPLELPGEALVSLAPLPVPSVDKDPTGSPAVRLFLARCAELGVSLADNKVDAIAALCRQVDGLPLAIEIAAARTRTLTVEEVLERLEGDISVLDRRTYRGEPRHRSITNTIEWSYNLLTPAAAQMLARVSVYRGSFSFADAQAVAATPQQASELLDELVDASLLSVDRTRAATRFHLLDTVRSFIRRHPAAAADHAIANDLFIDHVVTQSEALLYGLTEAAGHLVGDLLTLFAHIDEAVRRCIDHDATPTRVHKFSPALAVITTQAALDDVLALLRGVTGRFPDIDTPGSAQTWASLAVVEAFQFHPHEAVAIVDRVLAAHSARDFATYQCYYALAYARAELNDVPGAIEACRAGARLARDLGLTPLAQELEVFIALCESRIHGPTPSATTLTDIAAEAEACRSGVISMWADATRLWVLTGTEPTSVLAKVDPAISATSEAGYLVGLCYNLRSKAFAQILVGDLAGATATARTHLDVILNAAAFPQAGMRMVVEVVSALAFKCNHPEWPQLVASARSLPIVDPGEYEPIPVPPVTAAPLPNHQILRAVRRILDDLDRPTFTPARPDEADHDHPRLEITGPVTTIVFDGRSITVKTTKGIKDIARLIDAAGPEIHCTELAGVAVEQSSTGEVIDPTARRQYEDRIRELQGDIDDAERDNDYARSYRIQVELDTLIDHLTASLGHGQRTRTGADNTERARTAVHHRIRNATRQLNALHPSLGRHLDRSLKSGIYSSYRPEHPVTWNVRL